MGQQYPLCRLVGNTMLNGLMKVLILDSHEVSILTKLFFLILDLKMYKDIQNLPRATSHTLFMG